jgi:hypothetical protein
LSGVSVSVDRPGYAPSGTITVAYAGLPGNADDWVAIAPAGSDPTVFTAWVFTNGQTSGTATFIAPASGTYVARAFPNSTFTLLAESASFSVAAPVISTDGSVYSVGSTITVSYAGMPGYTDDWIAIAPAGAPVATYLAYVVTGGAADGTATFTAPATGSYVARAFPNNTYNLLAETPTFITTATPVVTTDKSQYAPGATITVTYAGLPGNLDDWIAVAPAGAPDNTYVAYVFTNGQTSGTATFTSPAAGTYVARAYPNNTFAKLAESTSFAVAAPTISTDASTYATGQTITVTYAGMPGNSDDWIGIAPAGAPAPTYLAYVLTNGNLNGSVTFTAPAAGSYVVRAFPHNTFNLLAESPTFTTTASAPSVATDKSSYTVGSTITVNYAGLPGNSDDWIGIATAGAPATTYLAYVFTNGNLNGSVTFTAPAAGTYVARAFPHNTFNLLAESPSFAVVDPPPTLMTDHSSYVVGATIVVSYAGLPGNPDDFIAIAPAGSPSTTLLASVVSGGRVNGAATFTAPATGSYVARAFPHNTFNLLAESPAFTTMTNNSPCSAYGITLSTNAASYADTTAQIVVTFAGMPGTSDGVLTFGRASTPLGTVDESYGPQDPFTHAYLTSGAHTFSEAHPYSDSYFVGYRSGIAGISCRGAFFSIYTPSPTWVAADKSTYTSGQVITVTYTNLPNTGLNTILLAVPGSPLGQYLNYSDENNPTGTDTVFRAPAAPGQYVLRAVTYSNMFLAESAAFTVTPASTTPATISTDKSTYKVNETITVTYSGLPGNPGDTIELALATDDNATERDVVSTFGQTSGTVTFKTSVTGSYVVRAHFNGTTNVVARSAVFTVTN